MAFKKYMSLNNRPSNEKLHYDTLLSLLKYSLTLFITIISTIGIIVGYITYTNGKELRDQMAADRKELHDNVKELQSDEKEQERDMQKKISQNIAESKQAVIDTRTNTISEIKTIKTDAEQTAKYEAKKSINSVFDQKNFDDFVYQVAEVRVKPVIENIVDSTWGVKKDIEFNELMNLIEGSDQSKAELSAKYFNGLPPKKFPDKQIDRIIKILKNSDINLAVRYNIAEVSSKANDEKLEHFFKQQLLDTTDMFPYALYYLIRPEIKQDYSLYVDFIKKNTSGGYVFFDFINRSRKYKSLMLEFLNSKILSQAIINITTPEQKKNIIITLKKDSMKFTNLSEVEFMSTLFMKMLLSDNLL